jgi:hypothetical protein
MRYLSAHVSPACLAGRALLSSGIKNNRCAGTIFAGNCDPHDGGSPAGSPRAGLGVDIACSNATRSSHRGRSSGSWTWQTPRGREMPRRTPCGSSWRRPTATEVDANTMAGLARSPVAGGEHGRGERDHRTCHVQERSAFCPDHWQPAGSPPSLTTSAMTPGAPGLPTAGEARRPGGHEESIYPQVGIARQPAQGSRRSHNDDPRAALRQVAALLDELLRKVEDVRASRLRQLADARSAPRVRAVPGSGARGRRALAGPDL